MRKAKPSNPPTLVGICYSINNAIQVTGFSRSRLYKFIGDGELETFRVGGRVYIAHADLVDLIDRAKSGAFEA